MYWIVTLGLFTLSSILPNAIMIVDTTPGHLARSLLFIPHPTRRSRSGCGRCC